MSSGQHALFSFQKAGTRRLRRPSRGCTAVAAHCASSEGIACTATSAPYRIVFRFLVMYSNLVISSRRPDPSAGSPVSDSHAQKCPGKPTRSVRISLRWSCRFPPHTSLFRDNHCSCLPVCAPRPQVPDLNTFCWFAGSAANNTYERRNGGVTHTIIRKAKVPREAHHPTAALLSARQIAGGVTSTPSKKSRTRPPHTPRNTKHGTPNNDSRRFSVRRPFRPLASSCVRKELTVHR